MMSTATQRDPRELVLDVERLLDRVQQLPDTTARQVAIELAQALLDLYGAGLERIVDEIAPRDDGELAQALIDDELVAHLLLLHGLHPLSLEERVAQALGQVRPYLDSHGGDVEVLEIEDSALRLRLTGSCSGCPSSTMTLKLAIENAIRKAAPEIEEVIAEESSAATAPLLQIEVAPAADGGDAWRTVGTLAELSGGGLVVKSVAGQELLFLGAAGRFYAYRPQCATCAASLADAKLAGVELTCAQCDSGYDVMRAGRCLDSPHLHLEPVPLLVGDEGLVKVALAAPV